MNCQRVSDAGLAEAYLSGRLSEADCEEYERHFFECERCAAELHAMRLAREELSAVALGTSEATARSPTPRRRTRWGWAAAAAVAASAVIAVLLWPQWPQAPSPTPPADEAPVSTEPAPAPPPVAPIPAPAPPAAPDWRAIADVRPSPYQAPVMRDGGDDAQRRFRAAMSLYAKGDYAGAIPGLEAAVAADPEDAGAPFFLGVSRLLTNDDRGGIEALRAAIARGDTPYFEEARLYLARAHLRAGDPDAASRELEGIVKLHGDREDEARQLLRKIEDMRQTAR